MADTVKSGLFSKSIVNGQLVFAAEMSDLDEGGRRPLWEKRTDQQGAILLHSEKLNKNVRLILRHVQLDADGDVQYWELVQESDVEKAKPLFVVHIFND